MLIWSFHMRQSIEERLLDFRTVSGIERTAKRLDLRKQVLDLYSGSLLGHDVEMVCIMR
jgi:hypothetical protein